MKRTPAESGTWFCWRHAVTLLLLLLAVHEPAAAQSQSGPTSPSPGACWRVQFANWVPVLDWSKAGHAGETKALDRSMRHVRDSIFDRDTVASQSNAMEWEKSKRGWSLMLYPPWWPAGVSITFDSVSTNNTDLSGDAVALVADASKQGSRARAHVWQVSCG